MDSAQLINLTAINLGLISVTPLLMTPLPKPRLDTLISTGQERAGLRIQPSLRVNPGYPGSQSFPIGITSRNMNCGNCAVAIDNILGGGGLQSALPTIAGICVEDLQQLYKNFFVDVSNQSEIEILLQSAGSGARGIVYGEKGLNQGHVFNAVNLRGEVAFIDGQSGRYANVASFSELAFMRTN